MSVQKFRKKPVDVEAVQFRGGNNGNFAEIEKFVGAAAVWRNSQLHIDTLEGAMHAKHGDWIIKGVMGEFYPCAAGVFDATYELAE